MTLRIFSDFHHEHLYESISILFEKRLGYELYRSIGLEWYEQGFWNVYNHPATAQQYLSLNTGEKLFVKEPHGGDTIIVGGGSEELRYANYNSTEVFPGTYEVETPIYPNTKYKAITLEGFKNLKFDIVMCSIPGHIKMYQELINKYQPQAKLIFQAGNNWSAPSGVKNILSSSKMCIDHNRNCVFYHQEFDLDRFKKLDKPNPKSLTNMMHFLQESGLFFQLEKLLPGWSVKCYGTGNRDGSRGPGIEDIVSGFKEMGFLWHVKREGDGFGYNIHYAAATGTPLVVKKSYLKGMTAEDLLIDGVTCIDMDVHSVEDTAKLLQNAVDNYQVWSDRVYNRFKEVVDYDAEEQQIRKFLEQLV